MEDAATAEISRAQIWQGLKHSTNLDDGRTVDEILFKEILADEIKKLKELIGEDYWNNGNYEKAVEIFEKMSISPECEEFLTLPAYEEIISISNSLLVKVRPPLDFKSSCRFVPEYSIA